MEPTDAQTQVGSELGELAEMAAQDLGPNAFAADVPEEGTPAEATPTAGDKAEAPEETSTSYYQSKYDKAQAELQKLQQQNELLMRQMTSLSNGQPQVNPNPAQAAQYGESGTSLKRPERPTKPATYDPIDATTDPSSESYQYREAMDQYNDRVLEYMEGLQRQQLMQAEQRAAQQAQQAQVSAWQNQLRTTYGLEDAEVREFMDMMDDPEILTLDNMYKFYRALKGQPVSQSQQRRVPQQLPLPPVPSGTQGHGAPPQPEKNADDAAFDAILGAAKSMNPW